MFMHAQDIRCLRPQVTQTAQLGFACILWDLGKMDGVSAEPFWGGSAQSRRLRGKWRKPAAWIFLDRVREVPK
jgi:hypothetical protein